jgi:hypothetical protein
MWSLQRGKGRYKRFLIDLFIDQDGGIFYRVLEEHFIF